MSWTKELIIWAYDRYVLDEKLEMEQTFTPLFEEPYYPQKDKINRAIREKELIEHFELGRTDH